MTDLPIAPLAGTSPVPFRPRLPGSKSITNRGLLLAAQRPGVTEVVGALHAEDPLLLADALAGFHGLEVARTDAGFRVDRAAGRLGAPAAPLFLGGAGTPARLMLAFAAEADGATVITGIPRLCERPMGALIDALGRIGIVCDCLGAPGCLPARVHGATPLGTAWEIDGGQSSQFVSALLMLAGRRGDGHPPITVTAVGALASRPYVDVTVQQMTAVGIPVREIGDQAWQVTPTTPTTSSIAIEPDASAAGYFLAAAAITGTTVEIAGLGSDTRQGDIGLARVLEEMGCAVTLAPEAVVVTGRPLKGITVDMDAMPDAVLTLAAVAAFADSPTRITGIANLRAKESDRISAPATELARLGIEAAEGDDWLEIRPGAPVTPATVETYNDHRMAMAFALIGLANPGVTIRDPACAGKSFPGFWDELARLRAHHAAA